jgi:hypothetical protein
MFWLLFVVFEVYVFQLCNILLNNGSYFSMHMGGSPFRKWLTELVSFKFIRQYMYFLLGYNVLTKFWCMVWIRGPISDGFTNSSIWLLHESYN